VLNASLNNIVASSVYQRLGYRAVSDVRRYQLG
jgi:predicted GNAT family acetyltransferase